MRTSTLFVAALLVAGCSEREGPEGNPGRVSADGATAAANAGTPAATGSPAAAALRWDLQSSGEGVALALLSPSGTTAIRLFCTARKNEILVNVPSFSPIGSEERLSFGSGGEVVALVADSRGDVRRGGVSGSGAVPDNLTALVAGPVSASYGAQASGPHPAPPSDLTRAFVRACAEETAKKPVPQPASACLTQDGKPVPANRIRAIGTEPFWGARIEGRCVTYSHPEDQKGTRVWTRFSGTSTNGSWTGALGGSPFVLRTRPQPGCSDGMSDNRYPIAVALTVGGEQRTGCALPL